MASRSSEGPCSRGHSPEFRHRTPGGKMTCSECEKVYRATQRQKPRKASSGADLLKRITKAPTFNQPPKRPPTPNNVEWRRPQDLGGLISEDELLARRTDYHLGYRLTGTCSRCDQDASVHGHLTRSHSGCGGFEPLQGEPMFKQAEEGHSNRVKYSFAARREEDE